MSTSTKAKTLLKTTFGADPELMVFDTKKGRIVSAIPIIKNSKHEPIDLGDGFRVFYDNVLLEFSMPPAKSKAEFVNLIRIAFQRIQKLLGERYRIVAQSSHEFLKEDLEGKVCWEAGCSPNFDVYGECANLPADFTSGLRTGSFHLHIGNVDYAKGKGKLLDFDSRQQVIKLLDATLGCASVVFDKDATSKARRALYGKAGEHRPTRYGIEYRVLGGYALRSPKLVSLVMDLVEHTLGIVANDEEESVLGSLDAETVREAINTGNRSLALHCAAMAGVPSTLLDICANHATPDLYKDWGL